MAVTHLGGLHLRYSYPVAQDAKDSLMLGKDSESFVIGVIGIILYGLLLVVTLWRTVVVYSGSETLPLTSKKIFHVLLIIYAVLEIPYYSDLVLHENFTSRGFICHVIALWFDLVAFSCVIMLWSRTLAIKKDKPRHGCIAAIDVFALFYTLVVVAFVVVSQNFDSFYWNYHEAYRSLFLLHAVVLLIFSIWLVVYGMRLQHQITNHPRWEPLRRERRLRIILKINGVLFLCTFCFLLRVLLLLFHFAGDMLGKNVNISLPYWILFSSWIPSLVPSFALLYMMRRPSVAPHVNAAGNKLNQTALDEFQQPLVGPFSPPSPSNRHQTNSSNHFTSQKTINGLVNSAKPLPSHSSRRYDTYSSRGAGAGSNANNKLSAERSKLLREQQSQENNILNSGALRNVSLYAPPVRTSSNYSSDGSVNRDSYDSSDDI